MIRHTQRHIDTAKANDISYHCFYRRVYFHGWTPEDACTKKVQFTYPKEIHELREKHGISSQLMRERVAKGWDVYTAATNPKGQKRPQFVSAE